MATDRHDDRAELAQLQFSTRGLLIGIAGCAVLVVVLQHLSALWGMTLVWFLLLLAAHVAATVRGTRQSARTSAAYRADAQFDGDLPLSAATRGAVRYAPSTRLRDNNGFGRVLFAVIAGCAALGMLLGTVTFWLVIEANPAGILLGGVSAGILAGILGFTTGSFVMVASRAFQEAAGDSRRTAATQGGNPS